MPENRLSLKEVEQLGYYDFMSYLGVPFFHVGGLKTSLELANLCRIQKDWKVLMVGCGAGLSSCFLAKRLGCRVVGVDIAGISIEKARARAKCEHIEDRTEFRIADAHNLPFEANTFDAVITEFVASFLDKTTAFKEFARVLKPGGYMGINELFLKGEGISPAMADNILMAEKLFREAAGLGFKLHTQQEWAGWLEQAGLRNIQLNGYSKYVRMIELPEYGDDVNIDNLPKYNEYVAAPKLPKVLHYARHCQKTLSLGFKRRMFKYYILSKTIREKLKKIDILKDFLSSNYTGCLLGTAKKPDGC